MINGATTDCLIEAQVKKYNMILFVTEVYYQHGKGPTPDFKLMSSLNYS